MNKFFQLSEKDKIDIVNQTVIRKKLPAEAIEKDIWVTAVFTLFVCLALRRTNFLQRWHFVKQMLEFNRTLFGRCRYCNKSRVFRIYGRHFYYSANQ